MSRATGERQEMDEETARSLVVPYWLGKEVQRSPRSETGFGLNQGIQTF